MQNPKYVNTCVGFPSSKKTWGRGCWARSHTQLLGPGLALSIYACKSSLKENQSRGKHWNTRSGALMYSEGACRQHSLLSPPCSIANHSGYLFYKNTFINRRPKDQKEIYCIKRVTAWGNQNFPWYITQYIYHLIYIWLSVAHLPVLRVLHSFTQCYPISILLA